MTFGNALFKKQNVKKILSYTSVMQKEAMENYPPLYFF